jgi:hypothetical protein
MNREAIPSARIRGNLNAVAILPGNPRSEEIFDSAHQLCDGLFGIELEAEGLRKLIHGLAGLFLLLIYFPPPV